MHVCYSLSAIEAGTSLRRTASLAPRLGEAVVFFKTNVTAALNKQSKEVSSELFKISTSFSEERQEAAKQALALATRKRGHAYSNARRDHSLGALSALFALSPIAGGLPEGCHVQERAETS